MPLVDFVLALILVAVAFWLNQTYGRAAGAVKPVLDLVLSLIAVGMGLWLINAYIPMAASIKAILNIVVVVATCVWVLQAAGLWNPVVKLWSDFTKH